MFCMQSLWTRTQACSCSLAAEVPWFNLDPQWVITVGDNHAWPVSESSQAQELGVATCTH